MNVGWKGWLGIGVTVFLIWFAFREVEPAEVWRGIAGANFWLLGLAVAIATAGFLVRALRWHVFLVPLNPETTLRSRWAAVTIGFMATNLLPARAGEFVRPYALSRFEDVPLAGAFGSLIVERFLDSVALLGLLLFVMAAPGFPGADGSTELGTVIAVATRGVMVLLAGMFLLVVFPRPMIRTAEFVAGKLPGRFAPRLVGALESFLDGFAALRDPRLLAAGCAWTLAFWCWNTLSFWVGFRAFGIEVDFMAALFVNSVVAFAVALPASPGYFGTFQIGAMLGLTSVYGVEGEAALAFGFGYHLGGFIPVTLIGLWYAHRLGISFSEAGRSEDVVEAKLEELVPGGHASSGDPRVGRGVGGSPV